MDSSNEERDELNRMAQGRRLEAGELGSEPLRLDNGREIRAGDQVLFDAIFRPAPEPNVIRRPERVENGTAATVVSVDVGSGSAVLRLHEPKAGGEPQEERDVTVQAAVPLELGYARHVYKAQGMTAEVADIATGARTQHNELYTMVTRSRDGTRIHALRADLEEMGLEPAELKPLVPARPEGALTVDEWLRQPDLLAELRARDHLLPAERQALVYVRAAQDATIRDIAEGGGRSSAKEAIGARSWHDPVAERGACSAAKDTRWDQLEHHDTEALPDVQCGAWTSSTPSLVRGPATADTPAIPHRTSVPRHRRAAPAPRPMPARHAMESVARAHASDRETATVLAYYEVMGRLHVAADPATEAARRWLSDHDAAIVVHDLADEQRVRSALTRLSDQANDGATAEPSPAPRILHAMPAYQERQSQRQEWQKTAGVTRGDLVEPGVVERAIVLAPDHHLYDDLTRALSVAAEAHLVSSKPDAWLQAHMHAEVSRIRDAQDGRARAESTRQAALAAEMAETDRARAHEADRIRSRETQRDGAAI